MGFEITCMAHPLPSEQGTTGKVLIRSILVHALYLVIHDSGWVTPRPFLALCDLTRGDIRQPEIHYTSPPYIKIIKMTYKAEMCARPARLRLGRGEEEDLIEKEFQHKTFWK